MLEIMKRTLPYLDEDLWDALNTQPKSQNTTVSELVRAAVRERYFGSRDRRLKAMLASVGIRKQAADELDAAEIVRGLRRGDRVARRQAT
jgi:hypothetical protein